MEQPRFRILLVEDNPGDVYLLDQALREAGVAFEFVHFADGASAMEYVRRGEHPLPDLALLDVNLPKRDGTEVLAAMRASGVFATVPVVMVSSSPLPLSVSEGNTTFLTKPSELEGFMELGRTLKAMLV
jgi:CheY-like chemotaxis protein